MRGILIGLMALILILPVSVSAMDYYVDVDSIGGSCNDNNNGRSLGSPWCTITRANSLLQAGDTIYIRAGIYSTNDGGAIINPRNSGTSGNPITYTNYQNEEAILRSITNEALYRGALIQRNYITIDGLKFDNINQAQSKMEFGVHITSDKHHVIIQNCVIQYLEEYWDVGADTVGVNLARGCTFNQIKNNVIRYAGRDPNNGAGHGIMLREPGGQYNLIEGNTVEYCGHSCINVIGEYNIIKGNTIYNPWEKGMDVQGTPDSGATKQYNVFEDNIAYDCGNRGGESGIQVFGPYNIIRRNIFYGDYSAGIKCYGNNDRRSLNNKIYHNVMYDNGRGGYANRGMGFGEGPDPEDDQSTINNIVKNNINYENYLTGVYYSRTNEGEQTFSNNWWDADGDPLFVDKLDHDFHLRSNSPCIDAGGWLTATRSAGSGNNIPVQNAGYFIDGFGIVEGDLIQFQGQTTTARITNVNYDTNTITVNTPLTWTSGQGVSLSYSGSAPDIGVYEFLSGEPPTPECGDDNCDPGETCSSCPQDCSCSSPQICCSGACSTPTCSQNSDCGSDPCKTYTCSNPGTCSSACSSQDVTSCLNDDGCCPSGCTEQNDNDCLPLGGPVAFWHFDEGFGQIASDSSGNGNDGTVNGANWTSGISGSALSFDGVNDYVSVPENDILDPSEITIDAWVRINSMPIKNSDIVAKGANDGYRFSITTTGKVWWSDRGNTNSISTTSIVPINEWVHITVVGSSSGLRIYINGELDASNSVPYGALNTDNTLEIGAEPHFTEYFNGTIEEVRIYDRALSSQEVLANYNELAGHVRADLNDDGEVDISDLVAITTDFGKKSGFDNPKADTDNSGEIDIFDVVFVASRFS
ncbi:MAG: hypothetical protein GTN38_01170, partial [Candidatus Aenigmarchaeota archaeon]|nr:hypothetical protein [Candidatus Aenigmarchaeota archaeon]NIP40240.1 hypothetical protein [Candidatus Aenigmarchaeota archaeon]NIQ17505.1 hypothetical protein [Candidatus Aenigmarchaeota archaeon]